MQFIVFLRGINVSGQKKIKMAELREALSGAGFAGVQSYIQSGNLIVEYDGLYSEVETRVTEVIKDRFGFDVPTIARTRGQLKQILVECPYLNTDREEHRLFFTLLKHAPEDANLEKLNTYEYPPEEWICKNTHVYGHSPNGFAKAKLSNNFFERILRVDATTRNLKTMRHMIAMTENPEI